jgi:hypothetical protein
MLRRSIRPTFFWNASRLRPSTLGEFITSEFAIIRPLAKRVIRPVVHVCLTIADWAQRAPVPNETASAKLVVTQGSTPAPGPRDGWTRDTHPGSRQTRADD